MEHERVEFGVAVQVRQFVRGVTVVDGDRHRPDLESGEDGFDGFDRIVQVDTDVAALAETGGGEVMGEPVRTGVQFPERDLPVADDQRHTIRHRIDGVFEQVRKVVGHAEILSGRALRPQ